MRALWELARRQLGLITRAQALQLVSNDVFYRLCLRGHVVQLRRGVWVVAGAPPTYAQAVLAAVLAAGEQAWASHRTAARLYGLKVPSPVAIDVLTLPSRRLRLDGVAHHRNEVLALRDLGRAGIVPATTVAKTLVDCTPWLPGLRLTRAVDDARRRKLVTYEEVQLAHAEVDKGPRTGRHLVVPLRPVVADRHDAGGSDRELDIRRILRRAGLPLPVQQHPVLVAGRWRFLDHAYPEPLVYLEFDGFAEHGEIRETFDDDRERDAELGLLGWFGIRYTSNTRPADLVSRVERALRARAA
ncbi:MAG: hypothetical protein JWO68_2589 [Actinomycetia bacterium]|nr:hypothetical protein [Actinomycetes bacterium]